MRASGSDEAVRLTTPVTLSLEEAIAYINDDELVEVTPNAMIRHRSVDGNNADRDNAFQLNNGAGRICVLAADIVGS